MPLWLKCFVTVTSTLQAAEEQEQRAGRLQDNGGATAGTLGAGAKSARTTTNKSALQRPLGGVPQAPGGLAERAIKPGARRPREDDTGDDMAAEAPDGMDE